jgi:predicted nucleotidyltransferase
MHFAEVLGGVKQDIVLMLGNELVRIIVYGSYSRGEYTPESDVDIFLIVRCDREKYRTAINELATNCLVEHGVVLSIVCETEATFLRYETVSPFFQNIVREGTVHYG